MMVARKNQFQELKKQVRLLQRKEERSRNQLKAALKKARQLGKAYKSKLATTMRVMKSKIAASHASTYAKVAADVQRQMLKSVETRDQALKSSIQKLEKKYISKFAQTLAKKSKKSGARKTTVAKETTRLIKKRRVRAKKK